MVRDRDALPLSCGAIHDQRNEVIDISRGLSMEVQMNLIPIAVHDEWGRLREVIVGIVRSRINLLG
jgi:hypothetical protein